MNILTKRRFVLALLAVALLLLIVAFTPWVSQQWRKWEKRWASSRAPQRPYGMAPVAFSAFQAACHDAKVSPYRIGQTIGDYPLSVGYHLRDGVLKVGKQKIDYCAAVDLGTGDLNRAGINRILHQLTQRGFACWYREHGHWTGREHIHAVFASLPMKSQLRGQVKLFLRQRRAQGIRPLDWERKVKRNNFALLYPKKLH